MKRGAIVGRTDGAQPEATQWSAVSLRPGSTGPLRAAHSALSVIRNWVTQRWVAKDQALRALEVSPQQRRRVISPAGQRGLQQLLMFAAHVELGKRPRRRQPALAVVLVDPCSRKYSNQREPQLLFSAR